MPGNEFIVQRDVMVPMRDGVCLATDVSRPSSDEPCPVVMHRSPYDKLTHATGLAPLKRLLDAGFAIVEQTVRGRGSSQGYWRPYEADADDGYDAVEWAASQPWSNGRVGIYGSSGSGISAGLAVGAAPPHLGAAALFFSPLRLRDDFIYTGGALELGSSLHWALGLAGETIQRPEVGEAERDALWAFWRGWFSDPLATVRHLPLVEAIPRAIAPYYHEWLEHPDPEDAYWAPLDAVAAAPAVKVPVLQMTGWYDCFQRGHLALARQLLSHADERVRTGSRLIVGPWDHHTYVTHLPSSVGERSFGSAAMTGQSVITPLTIEWFRRWLCDDEALPGSIDEPVRYFVTGENAWRTGSHWPPADATEVVFYLASSGRANSRSGDGRLANSAGAHDLADVFVSDPDDPVPTLSGHTLYFELGHPGISDQAPVEDRTDVLVYTSVILAEPIAIAGPVTVRLHVSANVASADFTAKLVDVEPTGYCVNLAEGIQRMTLGTGREMCEIDCGDFAHAFLPGHRIRLEIAGSSFPRFDRNLHTGHPAETASGRTAVQTVYHGPEHPSFLSVWVTRTSG